MDHVCLAYTTDTQTDTHTHTLNPDFSMASETAWNCGKSFDLEMTNDLAI